jgi:hypothetical protein
MLKYVCNEGFQVKGPILYPLQSPNLLPSDFYLWGHLKGIVYSKRGKLWHLIQVAATAK